MMKNWQPNLEFHDALTFIKKTIEMFQNILNRKFVLLWKVVGVPDHSLGKRSV